MKWTPGGESQDIEDRRDEGGGGGRGFQFGGMHLGIGGALILLVLSLVFKQNFFALLGGGGGGSPNAPVARQPNPARDQQEQPLVQFVSLRIGRHAKNLGADLAAAGGKALSSRQAGIVPELYAIGMRRSGVSDWTVLLSAR